MQQVFQRPQTSTIVSGQLPEFVREQYPTFVTFVEAYYEFLDNNSVDLKQIRDIDTTLDSFIQYFKAELAHNYPVSSSYDTERFLLKHIKDQYLAKGSEASYKLLFRLLYGKDVFMDYPGKSMLRVSDGRWQQDVSLFVRVDQGDPLELIGKTIEIQTSKRIYKTSVVSGQDAANVITANVENVIIFAGDIYEVFLNKNFYGEIFAGDSVKYGSKFQGQILPVTSKVKIQAQGEGFKPGQVFQVSSGEGTPIWFKVLEVTDIGGLKSIDVIKFGLGYTTDFSITVLPSSAVSSYKKIAKTSVAVSYSLIPDVVGKINIISGGAFYQQVPIVVIGGNGTGATAHAVLTDGVVTDIVIDNKGLNYTTAFVNIVPQVGDIGSGAEAEVTLGQVYNYSYTDKTNGFTEGGYLSWGDYWSSEFSDGAYVGTVARQFFVDAKDTTTGNSALLNVFLGPSAKYPGYYKTNDGFLDDSIMIQDSYYYQAFSYVIRIDEQLQSYAAVVRSMLHPSGMAMFGEYSINNSIPLSVALDSLVKSLGITLYDTFGLTDFHYYGFAKDLSTTFGTSNGIPNDTLPGSRPNKIDTYKALEDTASLLDIDTNLSRVIFKAAGFGSDIDQMVHMLEEHKLNTTKHVLDSEGIVAAVHEVPTMRTVKIFEGVQQRVLVGDNEGADCLLTYHLNKLDEQTTGEYPESGYVVMNPYEQGGYFAEIYANGRASEFTN